MFKTAFRSLFALMIVASAPAMANTETDPALTTEAAAFVQTLANDTIAILQDKSLTRADQETRFREMMEKSFKVDFIGQLALGRHFRTATEAQRAAYMDLFDDFMLNTILSNLSGFNGEMLAVTGTKPAGKSDIMVASKIQNGAEPYLLDWRIRYFGDTPMVIDVKAEGVSMVVTNREEFSSLVQRKGMDGFLATLQSKIDELKAETAAQSADKAAQQNL